MATGKVIAILRKKGFSEEQIIAIPDREAWSLVYRDVSKREKKSGEEICFTGFSDLRKYELETLAQNAGLSVKKSVTTKLVYLCIGEHPGPSKLAKAELHGAAIITEPDFLQLVDSRNSAT